MTLDGHSSMSTSVAVNHAPLSITVLDARRLAQEITIYLGFSIAEWMKYESNLAQIVGVSTDELHHARRAAALGLADLMVMHLEVPNTRAEFEVFIANHCDYPFPVPGIPPRFAGGAFLTRITSEEWKSLANARTLPDWLESSLLEWAQSQNVKFYSRPGAKP